LKFVICQLDATDFMSVECQLQPTAAAPKNALREARRRAWRAVVLG